MHVAAAESARATRMTRQTRCREKVLPTLSVFRIASSTTEGSHKVFVNTYRRQHSVNTPPSLCPSAVPNWGRGLCGGGMDTGGLSHPDKDNELDLFAASFSFSNNKYNVEVTDQME